MRVLIFSPHYDDAVFSCGEYMTEHNSTVVTVFGGAPKSSKVLTSYDSKFATSAEDAVSIRTDENIVACAILDAKVHNLNYSDNQYGEKREEKKVYEDVCEMINSESFDVVLAPLGLQHPDHILLRELVLKAYCEHDFKLLLYEDLPYRIIEPDLVYQVKNEIRERFVIRFDQYSTRHLGKKMAAVITYSSQLSGDINQFNLGVQERFWWVDEEVQVEEEDQDDEED